MLDSERDQFDCETCEMAAALRSLDGENAEAWRIFWRLYTRLTVQWGLIPHMFERAVAGRDDEDVLTLVDRLAVIHAALAPPQAAPPVED